MKSKPPLARVTCLKTLAGRLRTACGSRLLALLLLTLPAAVQAQFNYWTNNGTITISGYTGSGGAVTIPSTINVGGVDLPVTSIGAAAFQFCTHLRSVTIPNSITSIGFSAFYYCTSLASVTIPNNVTNLEGFAFYFCTGLTNVTIGSSVTSIKDEAFYYCGSLSSVRIPNSVTSIGVAAFEYCHSLTNVMLPESLTSIGLQAFDSCPNLTSVTIPGSVTNIGDSAFSHCTSLSAITVAALNSVYSSVDGVLFNKSQTTLIQCPGGKAGSYVITNRVNSIGQGAFQSCTNLASVTIPDSVISIGDSAFYSCTSLSGVTIPNSVTSIGWNVFLNCTSLSSVTIPNSVTNIGGQAFGGCTSLSSVTIPSSVTSIGGGAFGQCFSLAVITVDPLNSSYSSVGGVLFNKSQTTLIQYPGGKAGSDTIPNTVTSIGSFAFDSCPNLTSVTIPGSVTNIGGSAFSHCASLAGVYFHGNAPSVGSQAFEYDDNVTFYYLPGTTGWDTKFGGLRTVQWWLPNPLILDNGPNFGVQSNRFGFIISWATNIPVVVEACTNPANPAWSVLSTNRLTGGSFYFSDAQWTNYPSRFYRVRSP